MTRLAASLALATSLLASLAPAASARAYHPRPDLDEVVVPTGVPGDDPVTAPDPHADVPHFARPIDSPRRRPIVLDRAQLRAALAAARARNLAAFHAYVTAGIYPSNVYTDGALNVWRDQDGHFCAAATIIRRSGAIELTDKVAEQNNNIKLADVSQGPLMDWILTSGLTQSELALIQRPFMPVTEHPNPAPSDPMVVDARLRAKETARLKALYARIEKTLARQQSTSLDAAVTTLLKHPSLAWSVAASAPRPAPSHRS